MKLMKAMKQFRVSKILPVFMCFMVDSLRGELS
jgi:hypothetical protein